MFAHYTSVEGFYSILGNDNLRMTRSEFMNDPSDSKLMGKMIEEYLKKSDKEREEIEKRSKNMESIYKKANVMEYIRFIQERIHLYILSFTDKGDEMEFWNYYGNGGVQLNIDKQKLLANMVNKLVNGEEYLACAPVIYTSEKDELRDIQLKIPLAGFELRGKNNQSVFKEHMKKLDAARKQLYEIDNVQKFVDYFLRDYCTSIDYLLKYNFISDKSSSQEIMDKIYENQVNAEGEMIFKKDFLIYMVLLSALVKTDSYEYENETRIVYFENSILSEKSKKDQYELKTILGQKYIRPYIEFNTVQLNSALNSIVISPLTRNIPIDDKLYRDVVTRFMESKECKNVEVIISKHKCRW